MPLSTTWVGDQGLHEGKDVGEVLHGSVVDLPFAVLVLGDVEVLLPDVEDPVVPQRVAPAVGQALARQHHDGAAHPVHHVIGDHHAAGAQ